MGITRTERHKKIYFCPACRGRETGFFCMSDGFTYNSCFNCDLVFLTNVPGDKFFKEFYLYKKSIDGVVKRVNPTLLFFSKIPFAKKLISMWGEWANNKRSQFVGIHTGTKKILDIGTGSGGFLKKMQELGWDVYGVEMGENLIRETENKIGAGRIFKGEIYKIAFNKKFRVITFWHVFEHIRETRKTLGATFDVLEKKGALIIEVPHGKSLTFRLFRGYWTNLLPPQHLHFWSYESLKKILEEFDFKIKKVEYPLDFPFFFFSSITKKIQWLLIAAPILIPFSFMWSAVISTIGRGDIIRVYAEKQ